MTGFDDWDWDIDDYLGYDDDDDQDPWEDWDE